MKFSSIQSITFPNNKNEPIIGVLRQHNVTKPLFIICHGFGSSMEHPAIKAISESLYQLGYNTFTFDFSKSAQTIFLDQQVGDIKSIITYFRVYKECILLAASFGALSTAIATPKSSKIKGLITVNGFFGTHHIDNAGLRIYLLFRLASLVSPKHKKIWRYMKKELQPNKIHIPVLVIHSQADNGVSIKQSQMFYHSLKEKKTFHTIKDADHNLSDNKNIKEVVNTIDRWFKGSIS